MPDDNKNDKLLMPSITGDRTTGYKLPNEASRQIDHLRNWEDPAQYGLQWALPTDAKFDRLREIIATYFDGDVLEIGPGGGRWTAYLLKSCRSLQVVEGADTRDKLFRHIPANRVECFHVCEDGILNIGQFDAVFSYDVFVHFPPPLFIAYCRSVAASLNPLGFLLLHFAHFFPGHCEHNADCFKYWSQEDVLGLFTGFDLLETIDFPSGFGSRALLLRKGNDH